MPFGVSRNDSLFQHWGEIVTVDPAFSRSGPGAIEGAVFSGLVKLNTDLEVVADMAQRWEVSSDQTVFTFTLRENARFHDGRPVTAEDFRYSWGTGAAPGNGITGSAYISRRHRRCRRDGRWSYGEP